MESGIVLNAESIQTIAAVITAAVVIFGAIFAVYRWYLRQNKQDEDIKALKKEMSIMTKAQLACLKGLSQLGCNGPVTEATDEMETYLNEQAHS